MDWSGPVWDFYRQMSAVLAANMLTVAFVWAMMNYTKREREGRENEPGSGLYLGVALMVFGFLLAGLFAAGFVEAVFT